MSICSNLLIFLIYLFESIILHSIQIIINAFTCSCMPSPHHGPNVYPFSQKLLQDERLQQWISSPQQSSLFHLNLHGWCFYYCAPVQFYFCIVRIGLLSDCHWTVAPLQWDPLSQYLSDRIDLWHHHCIGSTHVLCWWHLLCPLHIIQDESVHNNSRPLW